MTFQQKSNQPEVESKKRDIFRGHLDASLIVFLSSFYGGYGITMKRNGSGSRYGNICHNSGCVGITFDSDSYTSCTIVGNDIESDKTCPQRYDSIFSASEDIATATANPDCWLMIDADGMIVDVCEISEPGNQSYRQHQLQHSGPYNNHNNGAPNRAHVHHNHNPIANQVQEFLDHVDDPLQVIVDTIHHSTRNGAPRGRQ